MSAKPRTAAGFYQPTRAQMCYPMAGRGQACDLNRLTVREKFLLVVLSKDMWKYGGKSRMTNLEIGQAMGMEGTEHQIIRRVMRAIVGRPLQQKRRRPGLEAKGFVRIIRREDRDPRKGPVRQIEYTAKWLRPTPFTVGADRDPDGDPESARPPASAAPAAPLAILPGDEPAPDQAAAEPRESIPLPAADPAQARPVPPAEPPSMLDVALQAQQPTGDQMAAVFGRYREWKRLRPAELAQRLVDRLHSRGVILEAIGNYIKPRRLTLDVEPLDEAEIAALKWLRDAVLALFRPAAAGPGLEAGAAQAAARIANVDEIRRLIGQVTAAPAGDDAVCEALADRLVTAFADTDPDRSHATYLGIARDTNRRQLAEAVLIEAFERACKSGVRNRGAAFIAQVKRGKAAALRAPPPDTS